MLRHCHAPDGSVSVVGPCTVGAGLAHARLRMTGCCFVGGRVESRPYLAL